MRVTRLGPTKPLLTLTGILSASESGPAGQVPTSNGSNEVAWGSNVANIWVNGTTKVLGPEVNIANGSNTTVTVDMVGAVASNTIRIHATGGAGSFGSNATRVSENSSVGASANSAREDHIHDGIGTITASSSNTMQRGTVNLRPGSGIALNLSDTDGDGEFDTISIQSTAAGGGGGGNGAPTTSEYVTTAVDSGLSAEVAIPGLAGSPDRIPASPNASDLEFDSSTIGGTALGSPTTIDSDTTVKSHLYIKKSAVTGFSLQGRYWTPPSTPFTVTAKFTDWAEPAATFTRYGFGVAESTPGKTEGLYIDGASPTVVSVISSTTPTTGAAYVQAGSANFDNAQLARPIYFRCVVVSSTDITWYYSIGGLHFRRLAGANRNPGFTIGSVFVSAHPEQGTYDVELSVDFIRFT